MTDHNESTHDDTSERGLSRRQALKKAGIVGAAAVWATPAVQVAFAPAAVAASPGGKGTCTGWTDSSRGFCGGTGGCPRCQSGLTCGANGDCISGKCLNGKCQAGNAGAACYGNTDCTSGVCGDKKNGVGVCKPNYSGGVCAVNADCFNGKCQANGTCAKSEQNEVCRTTDDCSSGLVCTKSNGNSVCLPPRPKGGKK